MLNCNRSYTRPHLEKFNYFELFVWICAWAVMSICVCMWARMSVCAHVCVLYACVYAWVYEYASACGNAWVCKWMSSPALERVYVHSCALVVCASVYACAYDCAYVCVCADACVFKSIQIVYKYSKLLICACMKYIQT